MDPLSFASFAFETYNALREGAARVKPCMLKPELELTPLNLEHIDGSHSFCTYKPSKHLWTELTEASVEAQDTC